MWNPFRKRKGRVEPPPPEANRVDALVDNVQRENRVQDLERELAALDPETLSPVEQETWWRMRGIAAFHDGRDVEAQARFEEAHRRFPDSARIRFSLGQQYVRARAIDRAFELFRTCRFPEIPHEYALMQARYAYLWNRYEDGLAFLRPFLDFYKQVRILDDHFVYVRGLPFFGRWWSNLTVFCILAGRLDELESVTRDVAKHCHNYDFEYLEAELRAYRDDAPEQMRETLRKRLAELAPTNHPTAYTRMNLAVLGSRAATSLEDAQRELEGVALDDQHYPWLEDIRTLALAEAAHRFGDTALERRYAYAFVAKQPLLFEPEIALNFHLLRYQERLKPRVAA